MSECLPVLRDAFKLLAGDEIGRGSARVVHASVLMPDCVVKCETPSNSFQNVIEWETWARVKGTAYARWFAPCLHISPCGMVLVMARTAPARPKEYLARMPVFLTDFKRANYGMHKGRLVCHDYGVNLLMENGMRETMRKADWWEE